MLKIRLKRYGRKKRPYYRVVAIDSRAKRDGAVKKEIGSYDPITKNTTLELDSLRQLLKSGAQPTNRVLYLMVAYLQSYNNLETDIFIS